LSAANDKTIEVWFLETVRKVRTLAAHSGWFDAVVVTPDGRRTVSASFDKTLNVWDLETGAIVVTFVCDASRRSCACADDRHFVAGDQAGRVHSLLLDLPQQK